MRVAASYVAPILTRPRRNPLWVAFAASGIIILISLVTSVVSVHIIYNAAEYPFIGTNISNMVGESGFLLGLIIGAVSCLFVIYINVFGPDLKAGLSIARPRRGIMPAVVVLFLPILTIMLLQMFLDSLDHDDHFFSVMKFLEFAGRAMASPLLTFFLGVIAIVGFYMALRQVHDFHNRIFGFAQLTDRVFELAKNSSAEDRLHIISYTPAVGFLARHKNWLKMNEALLMKDESDSYVVRILTQDLESLYKWHQNFLGRRLRRLGGKEAVREADIVAANQASLSIRDSLGAENYLQVCHDALPGYYCFFNSSTAILVTPLFLPLNARPRSGDPTLKDKQEAVILALEPPHMIGFATNDPIVIENLKEQFDYIVDLNDTKSEGTVDA
jgi:hypothetical protein